jgi:hypothetical protein
MPRANAVTREPIAFCSGNSGVGSVAMIAPGKPPDSGGSGLLPPRAACRQATLRPIGGLAVTATAGRVAGAGVRLGTRRSPALGGPAQVRALLPGAEASVARWALPSVRRVSQVPASHMLLAGRAARELSGRGVRPLVRAWPARAPSPLGCGCLSKLPASARQAPGWASHASKPEHSPHTRVLISATLAANEALARGAPSR